MSTERLSDERLAVIRYGKPGATDRVVADMIAMAAELQQLRAAKAASDRSAEHYHAEMLKVAGMHNDVLARLTALEAAKAADRDRVMEVVCRTLEDQSATFMRNGCVVLLHTKERRQLVEFSADVIAAALAVPVRPVLSDQELSQLRELRSECVVDDYPAAAQALDRLLSARPIPPLVRELVSRELCRVPAGEQHDWERQRLAECLEVLP